MTLESHVKFCPDCAEEIKTAARVCRFCGYRFPEVGDGVSAAPESLVEQSGHPRPLSSVYKGGAAEAQAGLTEDDGRELALGTHPGSFEGRFPQALELALERVKIFSEIRERIAAPFAEAKAMSEAVASSASNAVLLMHHLELQLTSPGQHIPEPVC